MSNLDAIQGTLVPIKDHVIVTDMYFGEQKSLGGLIILDDDGDVRGIYPRWARVHAKGPDNQDPYQVGDWVLIDHGRWSRAIKMQNGDEIMEVRMAETKSILLYGPRPPADVRFSGSSISDFQSPQADSFVKV